MHRRPPPHPHGRGRARVAQPLGELDRGAARAPPRSSAPTRRPSRLRRRPRQRDDVRHRRHAAARRRRPRPDPAGHRTRRRQRRRPSRWRSSRCSPRRSRPTSSSAAGSPARPPATTATTKTSKQSSPRRSPPRGSIIHGRVQGVFFRDTMRRRAESRGVAGWVRNRGDGTVEAVLEGGAKPTSRRCSASAGRARTGPRSSGSRCATRARGPRRLQDRVAPSAQLGASVSPARPRRHASRRVPELSRAQLAVYGGDRGRRCCCSARAGSAAADGAAAPAARSRTRVGESRGIAGRRARSSSSDGGGRRRPRRRRRPRARRLPPARGLAGHGRDRARGRRHCRRRAPTRSTSPRRSPTASRSRSRRGSQARPDRRARRPSGDGPISLGSATVEQLDTIEGIGPVTAAAILEFRDQHGGVASIDELDEISGIGPATMEALAGAAPAVSPQLGLAWRFAALGGLAIGLAVSPAGAAAPPASRRSSRCLAVAIALRPAARSSTARGRGALARLPSRPSPALAAARLGAARVAAIDAGALAPPGAQVVTARGVVAATAPRVGRRRPVRARDCRTGASRSRRRAGRRARRGRASFRVRGPARAAGAVGGRRHSPGRDPRVVLARPAIEPTGTRPRRPRGARSTAVRRRAEAALGARDPGAVGCAPARVRPRPGRPHHASRCATSSAAPGSPTSWRSAART